MCGAEREHLRYPRPYLSGATACLSAQHGQHGEITLAGSKRKIKDAL